MHLRQEPCFPGSTLQEGPFVVARGAPLVYERVPHIQ